MNLKQIPIEELELMSYTDMALQLLEQNKKPMNTPTIFKEICNLLDYTESEYTNKIGDFYTSMTIDKRFVLLESNEWDIRDNHKVVVALDDEDEELEEIDEDEDEDITFSEEIDEVIEDDIEDNDLEELEIVDDDETEEE